MLESWIPGSLEEVWAHRFLCESIVSISDAGAQNRGQCQRNKSRLYASVWFLPCLCVDQEVMCMKHCRTYSPFAARSEHPFSEQESAHSSHRDMISGAQLTWTAEHKTLCLSPHRTISGHGASCAMCQRAPLATRTTPNLGSWLPTWPTSV